ncbi:MAG: mycothiol-dependent nitroreductase Rv2466c family protein [Acidimicrobiales bacterium]
MSFRSIRSPWTWMTSRWLVDTAHVREFDVNCHTVSLAVLNEDRDLSREDVERSRSEDPNFA